MKNIVFVLLLIFAFAFCIKISSCSKKTSEPGCGCNSPSITDTSGVVGVLQFEERNYFTNKPEYILHAAIGTFITSYFVCDTTFQSLHAIIDSNRSVEYTVVFSGNIEGFCTGDTLGYVVGDTSYNIHLTSIAIY
jgi:hypothetical protein